MGRGALAPAGKCISNKNLEKIIQQGHTLKTAIQIFKPNKLYRIINSFKLL